MVILTKPTSTKYLPAVFLFLLLVVVDIGEHSNTNEKEDAPLILVGRKANY